MVKNFLLTILLLAIAYSQIFGGVTCCCFTRAISGFFAAFQGSSSSDAILSPVDEQVTDSKQTAYRCSKCAAKTTESTNDSAGLSSIKATKNNESPKIDVPCSCSKFLCVSSDHNEPLAVNTKIGGAQWIIAEIPRVLARDCCEATQNGSPPLLLLGKHSWQSLVCIWTV